MRMYVDCDSCPVQIREIIAKAAQRTESICFFVSNRKIPHSTNAFTYDIIVEEGKDKADNYIVEHAGCNDLVITRDILMAERLVNKKIDVVNDRGNRYTAENIRERVSLRNFMQGLSEAGLRPESTSRFTKKEIFEFANSFDRLLCAKLKGAVK